MLPAWCCVINRHIGARERRQLIPHVRFQVPFLGPESQLKSGFACAGLLCMLRPSLKESEGISLGPKRPWETLNCPDRSWKSWDWTDRSGKTRGGSFKNSKPIGEVGCCESISHLSIQVSNYLTICLTNQSVYLSICLSVYLSVYLSIYISVYLSIYLI